MLFSLYLLSVLYTNTMGLAIISKCKPFIVEKIESKGYKLKSLEDKDYVVDKVLGGIKFLIPGYYLRKALKLTSKDFNIEEYIENEKSIISKEEMISNQSIFRDERKLMLSSENYEIKPYRAKNNTIYPDVRFSKDEDMDLDFWEEKPEELSPYLIEEEKPVEIKKAPLEDYIDSISEEEISTIVTQLDMIRKLKKANEEFLNKNAS